MLIGRQKVFFKSDKRSTVFVFREVARQNWTGPLVESCVLIMLIFPHTNHKPDLKVVDDCIV